MQMKKNKYVVVLLCLVLLLIAGCGTKQAVNDSEMKTIVDASGKQIEIPKNVNRIADLWHANNQVVLLLGGADKLVATTQNVQKLPWFVQVYPRIVEIAAPVKGVDVQMEEIQKLNPDVVLASNDEQLAAVQKAGLIGVKVEYQDFAGLKNVMQITAKVIGPDAEKRADEYIKYLDGTMDYVKKQTENLSEEQKPSVLHIVGGDDLLKVDGKKTLIDQWITIAGGRNAVVADGFQITTTIEEIVKSNPDYIIIGGTQAQKGKDAIMANPAWSSINAVKNNRVICNPVGTFNWDRYSAEAALQLLWAGKLLHPELFEELDMTQKTQEFYQEFLHYELSAKDAERILAGKMPQ